MKENLRKQLEMQEPAQRAEEQGLSILNADKKDKLIADLTVLEEVIDENNGISSKVISGVARVLDDIKVDLFGQPLTLKEINGNPDLARQLEIFKSIKAGHFGWHSELTYLPASVAKELAKYKESPLFLKGLKNISPEAAEQLAKYEGVLNLGGLLTMSVAVAEHLAKHQGGVFLNGLTTMSAEVAKQLAKVQGDLYLDSLTDISVEVAEEFGKHKGRLWLSDVKVLNADVAEKLAKHHGGLYLFSLTDISVEVAEEFGKLEGDLWLDVRTMNPDVAERLAKHQGTLYFTGLTHISVEVAERLAKHRGAMSLQKLKGISKAVWEILESNKEIKFPEYEKIID